METRSPGRPVEGLKVSGKSGSALSYPCAPSFFAAVQSSISSRQETIERNDSVSTDWAIRSSGEDAPAEDAEDTKWCALLHDCSPWPNPMAHEACLETLPRRPLVNRFHSNVISSLGWSSFIERLPCLYRSLEARDKTHAILTIFSHSRILIPILPAPSPTISAISSLGSSAVPAKLSPLHQQTKWHSTHEPL